MLVEKLPTKIGKVTPDGGKHAKTLKNLLTKGRNHPGKTHLRSERIIHIKEKESIVPKDHMLRAVLPFV